MPWVLRNGVPTKVDGPVQVGEIDTRVTAPEVPASIHFEIPYEVACPECGKVYRTDSGLENHIASKHPDEEE